MQEMEVGPPEPAVRGRLQTTASCGGQGRIKAFFATPFERRMTGDEHAVFEDPDRVGEDVHVQNAAARGVRHAVQVAADRLPKK